MKKIIGNSYLSMAKSHLFLHQVILRWKPISLCILATILPFGFLVVKLGITKGRSEEEYVVAKGAFKRWEQSQSLGENEDHLRQLRESIEKYPELQAQYDPYIAQFFLAMAEPNQGAPFIERTLRRTEQPYYSDYSRTSLKISHKNYQQALEDSLKLKEKLENDLSYDVTSKQHYCLLFAFNLLRIAILHQQLDHRKQELETWKLIEHYGGWKEEKLSNEAMGNKGFTDLLNHFTIGRTTLIDYIIKRKEQLSSSS